MEGDNFRSLAPKPTCEEIKLQDRLPRFQNKRLEYYITCYVVDRRLSLYH